MRQYCVRKMTETSKLQPSFSPASRLIANVRKGGDLTRFQEIQTRSVLVQTSKQFEADPTVVPFYVGVR